MTVLEQREAARLKANRIRMVRSQDKRRVRDGLVDVVILLEQPEWATAAVFDVLRLQPGWGRRAALMLLAKVPMSELKLCGELTPRQLAKVRELLEERS